MPGRNTPILDTRLYERLLKPRCSGFAQMSNGELCPVIGLNRYVLGKVSVMIPQVLQQVLGEQGCYHTRRLLFSLAKAYHRAPVARSRAVIWYFGTSKHF